MKYAKGYRGHPQKTIGERPGQGHSNDKGHQGNSKATGKGNPKSMNKSQGHGGGKGHKEYSH
ncbi:hypothetical protein D4S03_10485 [bacterium]|nr:MAG: hypothetical protein D4S03_10485 [bacterium]